MKGREGRGDEGKGKGGVLNKAVVSANNNDLLISECVKYMCVSHMMSCSVLLYPHPRYVDLRQTHKESKPRPQNGIWTQLYCSHGCSFLQQHNKDPSLF